MQNLISIIIGENGGFMAEYHSISDLVKLSINNKQELWQVVLTGQAHDKLMSERDVFAQMKKMYQAMKSADEQYDQQLRSPSKMAGGDGYKCAFIMSLAEIYVVILLVWLWKKH